MRYAGIFYFVCLRLGLIKLKGCSNSQWVVLNRNLSNSSRDLCSLSEFYIFELWILKLSHCFSFALGSKINKNRHKKKKKTKFDISTFIFITLGPDLMAFHLMFRPNKLWQTKEQIKYVLTINCFFGDKWGRKKKK